MVDLVFAATGVLAFADVFGVILSVISVLDAVALFLLTPESEAPKPPAPNTTKPLADFGYCCNFEL